MDKLAPFLTDKENGVLYKWFTDNEVILLNKTESLRFLIEKNLYRVSYYKRIDEWGEWEEQHYGWIDLILPSTYEEVWKPLFKRAWEADYNWNK